TRLYSGKSVRKGNIMKTLIALAAAASAAVYAAAPRPPQASRGQKLTIDQLIDIKHPSSAMWSPDGRHVAFLWDRAGVSDWYIADVEAGQPQPRLALHNDAPGPVTWTADS